MVMALIGQVVVLLLAVVLLMMKMVILLVMRVRERRGRLAGRRVRQRPDFRLGRRNRDTGCATIGLDALVLEVVLPGVPLVMMVMVLHRVVKGMLSPAWVLLEVQIVLLVQVLVVLQVLRFHVPHRLCKQTGARQFTKLPVELRWSTPDRARTVGRLSPGQGRKSFPCHS